MTRARDVADNQENNGGGVPPIVAGKNAIINGAFALAQRGTSINTAATTFAYTLDRLWVYSNGPSVTTSQQVTGDTTNLPNIQYCARLQRQSGQTSTTTTVWNMPLETRDSIRFSGQAATISFYVRKSSTLTSGTTISYTAKSGTGTDQSGLGGYTGEATFASGGATLTNTWQRVQATGTASATSTEVRFEIGISWGTGTAGANDYIEITGVQLEAGSVATPFTTATGTIQGELAACQRYYYRNTGGQIYSRLATGVATLTTSAQVVVNLPVTMRTSPASVESSTLLLYDGVTASTVTAVTLVSSGQSPSVASIDCAVASGLTQFRPYLLASNNSTAGYIGFSAEL